MTVIIDFIPDWMLMIMAIIAVFFIAVNLGYRVGKEKGLK